jgi:hypothetical protein
MNSAGAQTYSFAELVDLYPTLCDLVGIDRPAHLEGESLASIIAAPQTKIKDAAFSIFPRNRREDDKTITGFSIRTQNFRYTEWIHLASGRKLVSELYDHRSDSLENINVVDEPPYAAFVKTLSDNLRSKFRDAIPGLKKQPDVFLYDPADLLFAKQQYTQKKAPFVELVDQLKSEADKLLEVGPFSVMQKTLVAPSNNKHDYYSLGPYWWPNPDTKDGLPYIRKDGKRNPEIRHYDRGALGKMSKAVINLSLAYFYTVHEPYAKKANDLLHAWFIAPETKMNPHLEYGQAIPGITEGRGIGIIETGILLKLVNMIGFLKKSESFSTTNFNKIQQWFRDYNIWLTTSEKGWDERMWHNNHGSSYDSQVIGFSLFTGQIATGKEILDSVIIKRINRQIEPDGRQPWELERTKSMSYSIKNLDHLIENAILAKHFDVDLWNYESTDGRSIKQAIRFLIPYMLGDKEWIYTQYGGIDSKQDDFIDLLWLANQHLDDDLIRHALDQLCAKIKDPLEINLLYPVFETEITMGPK